MNSQAVGMSVQPHASRTARSIAAWRSRSFVIDGSKQPAHPSDWRNSIVDLMKLTGMDSSVGARKRLAQEWRFEGPSDGSRRMNEFLKAQLKQRLDEALRKSE